jgi:hypothetical protein
MSNGLALRAMIYQNFFRGYSTLMTNLVQVKLTTLINITFRR